MSVDEAVAKYGEQHRRLITDGFAFLEEHEPKWHLEQPIDRESFVKHLLEHALRLGGGEDYTSPC